MSDDTEDKDTVVVIRLVQHEGREGTLIEYKFLECRKSDGTVVSVESLPVCFEDEQEAHDIARGIARAAREPVVNLGPLYGPLH